MTARPTKLYGRAARCVGHKPLHWGYHLTCAEYELLVQRAEGRCERCGDEMPQPCIDHDYEVGRHAVRGLVHQRCNLIVSAVELSRRPMDDLTAAYLANPFHPAIPAAEMAERAARLSRFHGPRPSRVYRQPMPFAKRAGAGSRQRKAAGDTA